MVVTDKLREPGDDLLSKLLRAEVDGDRLSETDLVLFAIEAERAGLDAVMVSEHIVLGPPADAAGSLYDHVTRGLGGQRAERPDQEHRVTVLG